MANIEALSEIEKNCLKQIMENEKNQIRETVFQELGIRKKAKKKTKKNAPEVVALLSQKLKENPRYQSMVSDE